MSSTIRWEQDADGVVVLTLDDPSSSANTMNDAYVQSMGETVDRLEREKDSIRGVVLTSAKKTFFAGGNLGGLIQATPETRDQVLAQVTLVKRQLRRLETLGIPVAAAINGAALGGGLEIALACHHRVVLDDPKVKLGFPEVTLGLLPGGGGIVRSVRLLGLTTALLELLLQGQQLRPEKALKLGLIHELAADRDELVAKARAWVLANETAQQPYDAKGYKVPGGTPSSPSLAVVPARVPGQPGQAAQGRAATRRRTRSWRRRWRACRSTSTPRSSSRAGTSSTSWSARSRPT